MSTNFAVPLLRHGPPLLIATALTFGGIMPFFNAENAILAFGLPQRIATSKSAQSVMILTSARTTAIGLALFTFYFQQNYAAMDTVLVTLGYVGLVDGYVCSQAKVPNKAYLRLASGLVIAGWGWLGLTTIH